jgi:hypothetical protein
MPCSDHYDIFLSHSHLDAKWVEDLANRLDDEGFKVWLDKWVLIPGVSWQQAISKGLDQAVCCAVCIGELTPVGWFEEEIERALDRQTSDASFRVIPILLPNAQAEIIDRFLKLRTWVDFRNGSDAAYAYHLLTCGIKGISPGRWPLKEPLDLIGSKVELKLRELKRWRQEDLICDKVHTDLQYQILCQHFECKDGSSG